MYNGDHYQAVLVHPEGDFTFSLLSAFKRENQLLQNPNIFDITKSSLLLHKVSAFGTYYNVGMKHLGDLIFQLETAEEIPK